MVDLARPPRRYGAILADPPWPFATWSARGRDRSVDKHYREMTLADIKALPVAELAAPSSVLLLWITSPQLPVGLDVIQAWGFTYKTVGFVWAKIPGPFGLGYWTRSGCELCLLATRGKPQRVGANVAQLITERRREHSRKPDCVHERIERLVSGPYLELFARSRRAGWDAFGNEVNKFGQVYDSKDDFTRSIELAYEVIRRRVADGGPGWEPKP